MHFPASALRPRALDRRFRQRRRRRHPGRPEDLRGARLLRHDGHHRADRAEHAGRVGHPRRAAGLPEGADPGGGRGHRRRRGQARHAACARGGRGGGLGHRPLQAAQRGARPGDGRHQRRPADRRRNRAGAGARAVPARGGRHAQPGRGGAADRPCHRRRRCARRRGRANCWRSARARCCSRAATCRATRWSTCWRRRTARALRLASAAHRQPQPARHRLHAVVGHRRAPGAGLRRCPRPWQRARAYVIGAMAAGADVQVGAGHGPLNHGFAPVPTHRLPLRRAREPGQHEGRRPASAAPSRTAAPTWRRRGRRRCRRSRSAPRSSRRGASTCAPQRRPVPSRPRITP